MLEVINHGKLDRPYRVVPRDTFNLSIKDNKGQVLWEVSENISEEKTITHWAYFKVGKNGFGGAFGDKNLIKDLTK